MSVSYVALIRQEDDGYVATFPDLVGCEARALTLPLAVDSAHQEMALYLTGLAIEGVDPPAPSTLAATLRRLRDLEELTGALLITIPRMPRARVNG